MSNWALIVDVGALYSKAGRRVASTMPLRLLQCADETPARDLLALIGKLGRDRISRRRWLKALEQILDAVQAYRATPFLQSPKLMSQLTRLNAARDLDLPGLLQRYFADPDNIPGLLVAIWHAGLELKAVRLCRTPRGVAI